MGERGRKSRKRSAANSESQPETPTYFLDACLGGKSVAEELRYHGLQVELHDDHFAQGTKDADWLPVIGDRGWILLTKDSRIRTRGAEIRAILSHGVRAFILGRGNLTGIEMAHAFVSALGGMRRCIEQNPPPFLATVTRSGRVQLLYPRDTRDPKPVD